MRLNIDLSQNQGKNIFFTSDFHLFHDNVIRFDNRPFANVDEMHVAIVDGWNSVVTENDTVIYLGDLSFGKAKHKPVVDSILKSLNGEIHFVMGNHDKFEEIQRNTRFKTVNDYLEVRVRDEKSSLPEILFCCMHYPVYSWNKSHRGSIHVHGHTHGNMHHGEDASYYVNRKAIDVGCMLHGYKPISFIEIIEKLNNIN